MIKPFISPITASKFRFYGCDRDQWKAALLTEIDADQLPIHYGGTLADPDGNPMYLTKVQVVFLCSTVDANNNNTFGQHETCPYLTTELLGLISQFSLF